MLDAQSVGRSAKPWIRVVLGSGHAALVSYVLFNFKPILIEHGVRHSQCSAVSNIT